MACPAVAGRPRYDFGDIVRQHRATLEATVRLSTAQRRVLSDIARCRTEALGGHIERCLSCGLERGCHHSCDNRHCPKCHALRQERWIAARAERLLPVAHAHVVFTLPSQLRGLVKYRPRQLLDALFAAASATLLDLGRSRLKARLGVTMVLHTWSQKLHDHPHVHALVTAGGLALDGSSWKPMTHGYVFPAQGVMTPVFRGKMMQALRKLHADGTFTGFDDFDDPEGFERLMTRLAATPWVVHARKPFRKCHHVLEYLGRYTHRVAISNSRLVEVTDQAVTFRTRHGQTTTSPVELLRRFVQHVLPNGFHKIRHFGLYSGTAARTGGLLEQARTQLGHVAAPAPKQPSPSWAERLRKLTGRDVTRCPRCGGPLACVPLPLPSSRDPPRSAAA